MATVTIERRFADLFSAKNVAAYYNVAAQNVRPYLGEALFPAARLQGLSLQYVKGRAEAPVILRPSAFDAHAPIRPRRGFEKISNEMPFFRESMKVGEKERQDLLQALAAGDAYAQPIIDQIYADQYNLVLGADAVAEVLRMELLSTGFIQFSLNDMEYPYDYGFDAASQRATLTGNAQWTNPATATPIADIQAAMDTRRMSSARLVMTLATYRRLMAADEVKNAMFPQNPPSFVSMTSREEFVRSALNITFLIIGPEENTYKLRVGDADTHTMFPDGVVTFLPGAGTLGNTYYGTTPEEADLQASNAANVAIVGNGVAVTSIVEPHPVNLNTIVSQIVLPSCPRIDQLYIMNVYTA